jgi:hypothetical protein
VQGTINQIEELQLKKPKWTTLIIIDSQAVKNTCNAGVNSFMLLFLQINQWD